MTSQRTVVVFTKPNCQPCNGVKRWITNAGVEFETIDVTTDPEALAKIKELGYQSTPVTLITEADGTVDHFASFAPTKLEHHFPKRK